MVPGCQEVQAPVGVCGVVKRCYRGWEKGSGQTSNNLEEIFHGTITLTGRHPFLISMQKKISRSLRGGKGSHLSFAWDAPGQETPPAFEGRGRWRECSICIRIHAYTQPLGGGASRLTQQWHWLVGNIFCAWPGED